MVDATADRILTRRCGERVSDPLAAGAIIPAGALYGLNKEGLAAPMPIAGSNNPARGVALRRADATKGDTHVHGATNGVYLFENSEAEPVPQARVGMNAGIENCHTVKSGGMPAAGRIFAVEDEGVWIDIGTIKP